MHKLTLVIPAKKEKESLPHVIKELEEYNLKIIVVLEETDKETMNSIKDTGCKILYQKNKGYGDAIKLGISEVSSKYFAIFNADGSFNPNELNGMYEILENDKADIVFASRYEQGCGSEDDTIVTFLGNYIFTKIGNIFFKLNITDILYTFVMANTKKIKNIYFEKNDFRFCVELPVKCKRNNLKSLTSKSFERKRISGIKKVNAVKDGLFILIEMIRLFFTSR